MVQMLEAEQLVGVLFCCGIIVGPHRRMREKGTLAIF